MRVAAVVLVLTVSAVAVAAPPTEPKGWKFAQGEKGKPAVLLIHGLAASGKHWTNPGDTWSIKGGHFKHWVEPKDQSGKSKLPKIKGAVRSFSISPVDGRADEDGSFWKFLVSQGFTVATWNQIPCMDTSSVPSQACLDSDTFDPAYASAQNALAFFATKTNEDIALVAHSRGGLIGRALLKETSPEVARIKWLITLHTPHHGSSMATKGNALKGKLKGVTGAIDLDFVPKVLRDKAKDMLPDIGNGLADSVTMLITLTGLKGAAELDEDGPLYKKLEKGEMKRAGVRYVTFGGNSARVARVFAQVYTDAGFDWKTESRELLDFPEDLDIDFDEMKSYVPPLPAGVRKLTMLGTKLKSAPKGNGGDLLVTDKSSHFGFEDEHFTNSLNHAEVLWSKKVKKKVAQLLNAKPPDDDDDDQPAGEVAPVGKVDE